MKFDYIENFDDAIHEYRKFFEICVDFYFRGVGEETDDMRIAFSTIPKYIRKSTFVMANKEIVALSLLHLFDMVVEGILKNEGGNK
jgi:hypothetical protein